MSIQVTLDWQYSVLRVSFVSLQLFGVFLWEIRHYHNAWKCNKWSDSIYARSLATFSRVLQLVVDTHATHSWSGAHNSDWRLITRLICCVACFISAEQIVITRRTCASCIARRRLSLLPLFSTTHYVAHLPFYVSMATRCMDYWTSTQAGDVVAAAHVVIRRHLRITPAPLSRRAAHRPD